MTSCPPPSKRLTTLQRYVIGPSLLETMLITSYRTPRSGRSPSSTKSSTRTPSDESDLLRTCHPSPSGPTATPLTNQNSFQAAADFCVKKLVARVSGEETNDTANQDYLDHFLAIKAADPSVTDATVVGWMLLNILAGADTTATTLTAVLYHLLKNPACLAKLKRELDAAALPRPVRYQDAAALPYLDACVKEALRVHPGVGLLLERVVPREGLALPAGGVFLPPGTVVGMNAWVVNNDKGVFGADAESFRPERWVRGEAEPEAAYEERAKRMRDVMLSFGAGRRVCLGRELSLFEIYKVVPMVVGLFDVSFFFFFALRAAVF